MTYNDLFQSTFLWSLIFSHFVVFITFIHWLWFWVDALIGICLPPLVTKNMQNLTDLFNIGWYTGANYEHFLSSIALVLVMPPAAHIWTSWCFSRPPSLFHSITLMLTAPPPPSAPTKHTKTTGNGWYYRPYTFWRMAAMLGPDLLPGAGSDPSTRSADVCACAIHLLSRLRWCLLHGNL